MALMLLDCRELLGPAGDGATGTQNERSVELASCLLRATRETDVKGWYRDGSIAGIIFTDLPPETSPDLIKIIENKIVSAMADSFGAGSETKARISIYLYPADWHSQDFAMRLADGYLDLLRDQPQGFQLVLKRALDIVGSSLALLLLSPLFAAIAIAIKLTSRGPVIFRQTRIGQYHREFTFLKFRSMYADNDPSIHRSFVANLIEGGEQDPATTGEFKIKNDPRVTPLGRFLRRSSLDELPQFWNVLRGDMSLVGPRPPVPYEVECYSTWHRRRLLAAKPGLTGLWQVMGRSRVRFDEMVRLDLRYATRWTLWLDLKILAQTPRAVLMARGAR